MGKGSYFKLKMPSFSEMLYGFVSIVVLGVFVGWYVNKLSKDDENKNEVQKLWTTLQDAKEPSDPKNRGPGSEILPALEIISDTEKKSHPEIWKEHIQGIDKDAKQLLSKLKFIVNKNHHEIYELTSARLESKEVLAKATVQKTWTAADLPEEIINVTRSNNEGLISSSDILTYAMIRQALQSEIFIEGKKQVAKIKSYANNLNAAIAILQSGTSIVPLPAEYLQSRNFSFKYRPLNSVFSPYSLKQEIAFRKDFISASPAAKFFFEQLLKLS